ncbi:hypothetical protein Golomagni_08064 [Golovinomyces magnicellulatus]|nr:hypothetical protein Golomagni_08064 [Golovinomyces magnicellulatus]
MVRICLVTLARLSVAVTVLVMAVPQPQLSPDPSGADNVGNGQGLQFITGGCLSDADCASGCCAGLASGEAVCSGPAVGNAQGKQGCGFGGEGAGAGSPAGGEEAVAEPPAGGAGGAIDENAAGSENVGQGDASQFITGQCLSDADCASGCCAGSEGSDTAACSAVAVAEENGKTGCGFGA